MKTEAEIIALLTSEEEILRINREVPERARWYRTEPGSSYTWQEALEKAAADICPDWEYGIYEFIGATNENATFCLEAYNPPERRI